MDCTGQRSKARGKLDEGVNALAGHQVGCWKRGGPGVPQSSSKIRSSEAALVALGKDSWTKTEVAAVLIRAKEQEIPQVRFGRMLQ